MFIRHLKSAALGVLFKILKAKLILFVSLVVCLSCTNPVTLNFRDFEEHLTANCLLTPDSVFTLNISRSLRADLEEKFMPVTGAQAVISEQNRDFRLSPMVNGIYTHTSHPVSGSTYKLGITCEGQKLEASTTVPGPFSVMIKPKYDEFLINITLKDNKTEKNTYWIGIKHHQISRRRFYYESYLSSDYLLFDDFNRIKKDDADSENKLRFSFHFYTRLDDVSFDGKEVSFDIFYHWPDSAYLRESNEINWLYIISADQHLDKYMKAALVQYELNATGDNPVFVNPISIYSNFSNGKGIFGSYTLTLINLNEFID